MNPKNMNPKNTNPKNLESLLVYVMLNVQKGLMKVQVVKLSSYRLNLDKG